MSKSKKFFCLRRNHKAKTEKQELAESRDEAINQIQRTRWKSIDLVLEEARTLALREEQRRRSADIKAAIYLSVLAAIVSLSATLIMGFSDSPQVCKSWQCLLLTIFFLAGMLSLLGAGFWAFKTIQVSAYSRVDVDELIKLSKHNQTSVALCKEILKCVRKNRDAVNEKITLVKKAHTCMLWMFIFYVLLLITIGITVVFKPPHVKNLLDAVSTIF
ncbi:MAG: hypothetical protein OXH88_06060 [Gammaproteobacteria bacterium]|nr:hypothetical protein [Gammaproteobacteria bacterium]